MESTLTEAAALARIQAHLTDTVRALPTPVGLSINSDTEEFGSFAKKSLAVPCYTGYREGGGPSLAEVRYWVVGVPTGQTARYFTLIQQAWTIADGRWCNQRWTTKRPL